MKPTKKIIYVGDDIYMRSGTSMSPLYTEDGDRYDYGFMGIDLSNGWDVKIRQATPTEKEAYYERLREIERKRP